MPDRAAASAEHTDDRDLEARLCSVLLEHGINGNAQDSIHSWRCDYPERYGPCTCLDDLVADLAAAAYVDGDPQAAEQGAPRA